jgi:hypothetical protein
MGYDGKYGRVTTEHGDIPEDEPVIVFRGHDPFVPAMLGYYLALCETGGAPQRHQDLVTGRIAEIVQWQREHPGEVKVPTSERSRAWMG